MKYLHQILLILLFSFLGEVLHALLPWPIPASIYGMGLLFAALSLKIIRVEQVKDGDVVLLHDMTDSSVDAALAIIDHLQAQGFTFVTVSELAFLRRETIKPGVLYECFPKE